MIELDIEELFAGSMEFEHPVVRDPYNVGSLLLLEDPEILTFTGEGIADRVVYRVGSCVELLIDDFLLAPGVDNTKPIIREPVSAGGLSEIPIGARLGLPGDTLRILDFEENAKTHIINIVNGELKSWTVHEDGSLPIVANTHIIIIQDGLFKSWTITVGGIRAQKNHSMELLKGLVKWWAIN